MLKATPDTCAHGGKLSKHDLPPLTSCGKGFAALFWYILLFSRVHTFGFIWISDPLSFPRVGVPRNQKGLVVSVCTVLLLSESKLWNRTPSLCCFPPSVSFSHFPRPGPVVLPPDCTFLCLSLSSGIQELVLYRFLSLLLTNPSQRGWPSMSRLVCPPRLGTLHTSLYFILTKTLRGRHCPHFIHEGSEAQEDKWLA